MIINYEVLDDYKACKTCLLVEITFVHFRISRSLYRAGHADASRQKMVVSKNERIYFGYVRELPVSEAIG